MAKILLDSSQTMVEVWLDYSEYSISYGENLVEWWSLVHRSLAISLDLLS